MKLYHTPSPNPQKIAFAMLELGLDCEIIPVDLRIPGRIVQIYTLRPACSGDAFGEKRWHQ
jgi:hypothetical protein